MKGAINLFWPATSENKQMSPHSPLFKRETTEWYVWTHFHKSSDHKSSRIVFFSSILGEEPS